LEVDSVALKLEGGRLPLAKKKQQFIPFPLREPDLVLKNKTRERRGGSRKRKRRKKKERGRKKE